MAIIAVAPLCVCRFYRDIDWKHLPSWLTLEDLNSNGGYCRCAEITGWSWSQVLSFSQVAGSTAAGSEKRARGGGRSSEKRGGCNERRAGETAAGFPADPAAVSGGSGGVRTPARNYTSHQWKSGKRLYWKHSLRKRKIKTKIGWEKGDGKSKGEEKALGSLPPLLNPLQDPSASPTGAFGSVGTWPSAAVWLLWFPKYFIF